MVLKDLKAGLPIALVSVLLISVAQLAMKWGMGDCPPGGDTSTCSNGNRCDNDCR